MPGKKSIEDMRQLAKSFGGDCLSKEYISARHTLTWRCKNNHVFDGIPNNQRKGLRCPICANRPKLSIDEFHKIASHHKGHCLSNNYLNNRTKLDFICEHAHKFSMSAMKARAGQWCAICDGNKKLSIAIMQEKALSRGEECLSDNYINSREKLKFRCKNGHYYYMTAAMYNRRQGCSECNKHKMLTIELMKTIAKSKSGSCLSNKYFNRFTKLLWQCHEGHKWSSRPADIMQGQWCPICSKGTGERLCRAIFEKIFGEKFSSTKSLKWLVNSKGNILELDGFSEKLKLAFEYQGIQHYEYNPHFHRTENTFNVRKEDDLLKQKLCHNHGVTLIEVHYYISHDDLYSYIIDTCRSKGVIVPSHDVVDISKLNIYTESKLKKYRELAKLNNCEILSNNYLNSATPLFVVCNVCKNEWFGRVDHLRDGYWCAKCKSAKNYNI